jgi:hypothetical protein
MVMWFFIAVGVFVFVLLLWLLTSLNIL